MPERRIDATAAEAVTNELVGKGGEAISVIADVTKSDQAQAMVDAVVRHWGSLSVGVNNAGVAAWADSESVATRPR